MVDRRIAALDRRLGSGHGQCQRGTVTLRQIGKRDYSDVLQRARALPQRDAARYRHQWLVLQYAADGAAVCHRRLFALSEHSTFPSRYLAKSAAAPDVFEQA